MGRELTAEEQWEQYLQHLREVRTAERERCAKVAEGWHPVLSGGPDDAPDHGVVLELDTAAAIAAAIRALPEET